MTIISSLLERPFEPRALREGRLERRAEREERERTRQCEQDRHSLGAMRRLSGEIAHFSREQMREKMGQLQQVLQTQSTLFRSYADERCACSMRMPGIAQDDEKQQVSFAIERLDSSMKLLEREIKTHQLMVEILTRQISYSRTLQGNSPIAEEIRRLEWAVVPRSERSDEEKAPSELHSEERLPRPIRFSLEEKLALCAIYQNFDLSSVRFFHGGKEVTLIEISGYDQWKVKEVESGRELVVSPESLVSCPQERGEHYPTLLRDWRYKEYVLSEISVERIEFPTTPDSNAVIHCYVHHPRSTMGLELQRLRTLRDAIPGAERVCSLLEQIPNGNYRLKLRPQTT